MFDQMSEDDLIKLLSGLQGSTGGGLPGKTPASRLNYYQDMISTLGFDPIQALGSTDPNTPEAPEYVPAINKQRFTYESDPTYKKIFDLIDAGAPPATAVKTAGITDPNLQKEAQKVAIDYAGSVVDEKNNKSKFDQANVKNKAKYTAPDGSKYKNAPLGGTTNDIMATAPEYDLMGSPTADDLLNQLIDARKIPARQAEMRTQAGSRSAPTAAVQGYKAASAGQSGRPVLYDSVNGDPNTNNAMWNPPSKPITKEVPGKVVQTNGPERSWEKPTMTPTGKSLIGGNALENMVYHQAATQRLDQAKKTQVRSDANNNAMRRVLALRTILGG